MLRRVTVIESGDTDLLPGELVDRARFEAENRRVVESGGQPASARPVLMGITKASLATESWLSAASFQETTRVLTDAAINARSDSLRRAEGERDHRQAHPGRYRHRPLPQHPGRAHRGGARGRVLAAGVRRDGLGDGGASAPAPVRRSRWTTTTTAAGRNLGRHGSAELASYDDGHPFGGGRRRCVTGQGA